MYTLTNQIIDQFNENNIRITINMAEQFENYLNMIIEYNKITNLTAITEPTEIICKHFIDSCIPHFLFKDNASLCDIGTGAGFPAIPLKIIRPDLKISMVDSLQKRIQFLEQVINTLKLENITATHSRAQEFCSAHREFFDYTVARAVAPLNILSELCLPLTKINGQFMAYKSQNIHIELCKAENAITVLGGKVDNIYTTDIYMNPKYLSESENNTLKNNNNKNLVDTENDLSFERNIVVINKIIPTPRQYPRLKDKILKQPL